TAFAIFIGSPVDLTSFLPGALTYEYIRSHKCIYTSVKEDFDARRYPAELRGVQLLCRPRSGQAPHAILRSVRGAHRPDHDPIHHSRERQAEGAGDNQRVRRGDGDGAHRPGPDYSAVGAGRTDQGRTGRIGPPRQRPSPDQSGRETLPCGAEEM